MQHRINRVSSEIFITVLVIAGCCGISRAQGGSSSLLGQVRSGPETSLAGVKITAVQDATGFTRTCVAGPDGSYRLESLPPGEYTVKAEKDGYRTLAVRGIRLDVEQKGRLDLSLAQGATHDTVLVTARVSPVQEDDASVAYRLDSPVILELPLTARNVISLVTLGPGAIPRQLGGFTHDVVNDLQPARGAVALNPPVNGARSTMNTYVLDGAADTDRNTFAIAATPPMEAVREFRITSSLASAELPQAGGAVVDVVTKSGSAKFHGSAFEYLHNEATDARNYFDDPLLPRAVFRQNQFGGSAGGPLLPKHSTFFFVAYEGARGKSAKSALNLVPDAGIRAGDFSGRNPIFDPLALDATGARQPFPGNVIPANRINATSSQFLQLYEPLPNSSAAGGNYLDATPNRNTDDSVSGRVDHQFSNHSMLFARYTLNNGDGQLAGNFPLRPVNESLRAQQVALGHTAAAASWINEARAAFTRLRVFDVPESAFRTDIGKQLGIQGLPQDPFSYGLPVFLITNFSTVADDPTLPQTQRDNMWHFSDAVSLPRGRHTIRAGAEFTRQEVNFLRSDHVRGQFVFTGAFTGIPGSPDTTGDAFGDFLLGLPQVTTRTTGSAMAYLRQNIYGAYVQDEWRVSSGLTLNFGVRYEYYSPLSDAGNRLYNLDYSNLPAPPAIVNVRHATLPDRNDFAPRAGFAWKLPGLSRAGHETVFRAGYGIYYSQEIAVSTYDLIRNQDRNETNQTDGITPILTIQNGFPQTSTTGLPGYFGMDPGARTPYVQQWSASVQRVLPGDLFVEVGYVGTKGTKLGRFRQFNTPLHVLTGENLDPRPGELQSLRQFPDLGAIVQRQNISNSSYESLQIKTERRFSRRLGLLASFVWSKSIDDADSVIPGLFDSAGAQDERNLRLERGLSFFNVGRRVSAGFVYSLPALAGTRGAAGRLLKDWQFSGIITLQDGTPLNPFYFAYDGANTGTPNRPDVVYGQSVSLPRDQRTADHFFNTAAFATPKPFTFGNAGRNIIPGPGNNIFDLALHRRFAVGEGRSVEFRGELLNAFNHPNWGIPGNYPDFGPFFGKIFVTGDPRRVQFGLRLDF